MSFLFVLLKNLLNGVHSHTWAALQGASGLWAPLPAKEGWVQDCGGGFLLFIRVTGKDRKFTAAPRNEALGGQSQD